MRESVPTAADITAQRFPAREERRVTPFVLRLGSTDNRSASRTIRNVIPIRDELAPLKTSYVTWVLLFATIAAYFLWQLPGSQDLVYETAVIPCELMTGEPASVAELLGERSCTRGDPAAFPDKDPFAGLIYSVFLHGSVFHLLFNMWSLWIFGNNVEDAFGHLPYLLLYGLAGLVGSMAHVVLNPTSTIPLIGASGAIAGVMGAYLVLFPRARIVSIIPPLWFFQFRVPASIFLGFWFLGQFFVGDASIAWEAHVGGFIIGSLVALARRDRHIARLGRLGQGM